MEQLQKTTAPVYPNVNIDTLHQMKIHL